MSYKVMSYDEAHEFVDRAQSEGRNVRWEGWDMIFFTPNPKAPRTAVNAGSVDGVWGFVTRVPVLDNGTWSVPAQYVNSRRARSRSR